ncbi:GGDEF domain-containing protein [Marinomonas arenicola]|uniref:GGDEF domain-containing protein n=1 Tax=Marinomonas arenicola TaxID=569601 RepID=UPI00311DB70D
MSEVARGCQPDAQRDNKNLIQRCVHHVFYFGLSGDIFSEQIRRTLLVNLFSIVGIVFTFPLGIAALYRSNTWLALVLLCFAFIFCINQFYLRRTRNHEICANIIIYPLYFLMLYLVFTGGVNGTGYVWIFCVPAVSLFIQGIKRGVIEMVIFTLLLIVILYFFASVYGFAFHYDEDLRFRVIASFIVVFFLSTIYEYSMSRFNKALHESSKQLKELAETDPLTQLLNRRGMQQRLEEAEGAELRLVLIDVDYFKNINDQYGHDCGDFILRSLARLIQKELPEGAWLSRWGGEEFLLALNDAYLGQAIEVAEKIRQAIEGYDFNYDEQKIRITASFGIVPLGTDHPLALALKAADSLLYKAKDAGRNNICV